MTREELKEKTNVRNVTNFRLESKGQSVTCDKCTVAKQFVAQSNCPGFELRFTRLRDSLGRSPLNCDDFSPSQSLATSVIPNIFITFTERLLEDHESVVDVVSSWPWDSENKLVLNNRREKYALFRNPQVNRKIIILITYYVWISV